MVQRITGLASGMDIDSMVKQLMTAERIPLDKMKQKQQVLEWQRDDYRTMNSLFYDFQSTLSTMKYTTQYRVRSTASSNENYVTATASSAASTSSATISSVSQLATAATKVNGAAISADPNNKLDVTKSLESQNFSAGGIDWKLGSVETQSISVPQDGLTSNLDLKGETLNLDPNFMNVEVNGKHYNVITGTPTNDNDVSVDNTGKLTFKNNVTAGSVIKVDYVTNAKIDQQTVTKDATEMQLNLGNYSLDSIIIGTANYTLGNGNVLSDSFGNVLGTFDSGTGKITFSTPSPIQADTTVEIHSKENYSSFNIQTYTTNDQLQSKNFLFTGSDTLNSVMNIVNSSKVGVTMFYDSFKDQVTLTRTETGNFHGSNNPTNPQVKGNDLVNNEIITGGGGNFLNTILQFDTATETGGTNAKFTINGLDTERNSNSFSINGVTYTLKQVFDVSTPVTVSINNDGDKVFDNIKAFVDKYNTLIDTVNKKITEERYRDYTPLTDDQRQTLSDKQQEQWDVKAKSGLIKGDTFLSSALTQMRTSVYQPVQNSNVSSVYNQLASIGITTTNNFMDGGKLLIDENKLKQAIETDPVSVENLFRGTGDTVSSKGIVQRLSDNVTSIMGKLTDKAGSNETNLTNNQFVIGRNLIDLTDHINAFNNRLTKVEDRYYSQFTAMEQAIQKSNQQATYIQSYFGSGK